MIIVKCLRYLRGYLLLEGSGGYIERMLNLISQKNISCWNIHTHQCEISCMVFAKNYRQIASCAKKTGVRIRIKKKYGLPFLMRKRRKRIGLLVGIFLFIAILLGMQNFIWSIEITGNDQISTQRIINVLQDHGIRMGAFLPTLDLKKIQNEVTIELGDVSWLSINNLGSRISVELKEDTKGKEITSDTPCNIVASKPGYIQRIEVYSGQKIVGPGDVVAKGDLLVSGIRDIPEKENGIYEHSEGRIFAQTVTNETFICPKQKESKQYTGVQVVRNYLAFGDFKLPLFIAGGKFESDRYDATTEYQPFHLFGMELPFGTYHIKYNEYSINTVTYDSENAKIKLDRLLQNYLKTRMKDAEILDAEVVYEEDANSFYLKAEIIAIEDIAQQQALIL